MKPTKYPKTYLLRWNPAISSYNAERYNIDVDRFDGYWLMDWSIYEYENLRVGDRYFMVREGDGVNPGIYFCGVFTSEAYPSKDWRGTSRVRYYADMEVWNARPLEQGPWIPTSVLEEAIPAINWRIGHAGELITDEQAKELERLWVEYTQG